MAIPKHLTVVVAGSGETKDIEITPSATAEQIVRETGLEDYHLSRVGAPSPFRLSDDLYNLVDNHERIYATPANVEVGISSVKVLSSLPSLRGEGTGKVVVIKNDTFEPEKRITHIYNGKALPYWQEQGWTRNGSGYQGQYRTPYGRWKGMIVEEYSNSFSFYIFDPPQVIRTHSHWPCFMPRGYGKYFVHFSREPKDISTGIIYIEKIVTTSFKYYGNGGQESCRRSFLSRLLRA